MKIKNKGHFIVKESGSDCDGFSQNNRTFKCETLQKAEELANYLQEWSDGKFYKVIKPYGEL